MKLSDGSTKLVLSTLIFVFYGASFLATTSALRGTDVSLAYAIWSGSGTVLIAAIVILYIQELATALKIISIALIVVGVAEPKPILGLQKNIFTKGDFSCVCLQTFLDTFAQNEFAP
jgi:small multidrug resistance pump